ncbi:MAG TPA: DUF3025 domain-containing protein [Burkholderiales bacterium]|nr:DUF3025 domain-containing protein [Burkholderiales bacterium]
MADLWNVDWLTRSDMFAPLRVAGGRLPDIGWPNPELLNAMADAGGRIVNAQGTRVRFVNPSRAGKGFEDGFEPRAYLKGEVQVRPLDWHDLFNALVWMTFPTAKAVINARHYETLSSAASSSRSAVGDALTMFDEDGVVVLSSDTELLELVRAFRWKELFWKRREDVRKRMRFFLFGHALYQKALNPFVGMTGKAILQAVPDSFANLSTPAQVAQADRLVAAYLWDRSRMNGGRELSPLPVLGVPGWHAANEEERFYEDSGYFRPGRSNDLLQPASPSAE